LQQNLWCRYTLGRSTPPVFKRRELCAGVFFSLPALQILEPAGDPEVRLSRDRTRVVGRLPSLSLLPPKICGTHRNWPAKHHFALSFLRNRSLSRLSKHSPLPRQIIVYPDKDKSVTTGQPLRGPSHDLQFGGVRGRLGAADSVIVLLPFSPAPHHRASLSLFR